MNRKVTIFLNIVLTVIGLTWAESWGWRADINGTRVKPDASDAALSVTVDVASDFVAGGSTENTLGGDFTVIKFSRATGEELWRQVVRNDVGFYGSAQAVAVDQSGNVVGAGETERLYHPALRGSYFTVIKFDGASGSELWRRLIRGTATNDFYDIANAVAIDADSNVIVAGVTFNAGTSADFTVAKLNGSTGAEIWRRTLNGTANGPDAAQAVTVDSKGHVIAGGYLKNVGTDSGFTVVKFDGGSGAELWRRVINGSANFFDSASAVVVDAGDHVIAAGSLSPTPDHTNFVVMKFDATSGAERWRQIIQGSAIGYLDGVSAVSVDRMGNAVAVGVVENAGTSGDFAVVKLDGTSGVERWRRMLNGTANGLDSASAVTLDAGGNAMVAGYLRNAGARPDFTLVKFDGGSGIEQWRQVIKGSANRDDIASAVAVDAAGDAVGVGVTWNLTTGRDFAVVKVNGSKGSELWRQEINGVIVTANDQGNAVALDGNGNVVAAGFTENDDASGDLTVVKVDGANGTELWRRVMRGTGGTYSFNTAYAVTIDAAGDPIAAGFLVNASTGPDFTVIKFDGESGLELWRQVINGTANGIDVAYAVTVDAAGDVIAAGITTNDLTLSHRDFTVMKFEGATGTELWRQTIGGRDIPGGVALTVTVDGEGNVIAGGRTTNIESVFLYEDFTVTKIDGKTGMELWRCIVRGTALSARGEARSIAVDLAGNVAAAGTTMSRYPFDEFTVVKVDGASGEEQWRQTIRGTADDTDAEANAVAVDTEGNIVAAGTTLNVGTLRDLTVIKFDGLSGGELWRQTINSGGANDDRGRAVAVDAAGNVAAAGVLDYPSGFAVIKLDGTTGMELWRRRIQGTSKFWDEARAIAVGRTGDVIATGKVRNRDTLDDLAVVKLRGPDGGDF